MTFMFRIALSLCCLWSFVLYAEVHIEITKGVDSALPIGIVPFRWSGLETVPENISNIITNDLYNSGQFHPIDPLSILKQPIGSSEVTPEAWRKLGINTVIVGQIEPSADDSYVIFYKLVDTSGKTGVILAQNKYKVAKKWLRYAAHAISDEIFEYITGIKGIFRTRIAYIAHISSHCTYPYELRIADYDGYNQTSVYRSSEPLMSPAWLPDGRNIAYVAFKQGNSSLVIQTLDNGTISQIISFPQHNGAPSISPDGRKLAFASSKTGSLNIYVMDLISRNIHQVTNNRSNNTEPSWFPDNHTIAYTSDQCGHPQIYKIDLNQGNPQRLSWKGSKNQNANVSQDGNFLVLVHTNNSSQQIAKLNLATGDIQVLTDACLDETPSIAPNGAIIIYSSTSKKLGSSLQIVSTNSNFKKCIVTTTNGRLTGPTWSPFLSR